MERVYGPYEKNDRWRIFVEDTEDKRRRVTESFETREEAYGRYLEIKARLEGRTIGLAVDQYLDHLKTDGGHSPRGIETKRYKLHSLLRLELPLSALTPGLAQDWYLDLTTRTKAWTHHKALGFAKQWGTWVVEQGWLSRNPFGEVKAKGRTPEGRRGTKLRKEEVTRLLDVCLDEDSPVSLLVAVLILTGARVSEVLERVCRDVHNGGEWLEVEAGKTENADRTLVIPLPILCERLVRQAARGGDEPLWGYGKDGKRHTRGWTDKNIRRLCRKAGVPVVSAHAFRRTFSSITKINGVAAEVLARALGHGNVGEQDRSYVAPGINGFVNTLAVTEHLLRKDWDGRITGETSSTQCVSQPNIRPKFSGGT